MKKLLFILLLAGSLQAHDGINFGTDPYVHEDAHKEVNQETHRPHPRA